MISIIIVNYKAAEEVINCITSILSSKPKIKFEIIVVDNDGRSTIEENLKEQFPKVKYIKSPKNIGYGAGNNLSTNFKVFVK